MRAQASVAAGVQAPARRQDVARRCTRTPPIGAESLDARAGLRLADDAHPYLESSVVPPPPPVRRRVLARAARLARLASLRPRGQGVPAGADRRAANRRRPRRSARALLLW